ncbi:MAG: SxtJ family membrane protein [Candidatus Melainabacteria bacterium]
MSTMTQTLEAPNDKLLREFGLIFGGGVILLFGVIKPLISHHDVPSVPYYIGVTTILMGLILPQLLSPFYKLWMKFGDVMGAINSKIILGLLFFAVVLPIGLVMRQSKDPMNRKAKPGVSSYRIPSQKANIERMEKPY